MSVIVNCRELLFFDRMGFELIRPFISHHAKYFSGYRYDGQTAKPAVCSMTQISKGSCIPTVPPRPNISNYNIPYIYSGTDCP
jgi:hypothetical protein